MAEGARMTAGQLADKLMSDEHADVLWESVAWMARELMEAVVSAQIGAELGERSLERPTQRNGYRSRDWDTRVGSIELAIPSWARAPTSRRCWSRAAAPSRPWSRWCRRPR
jgi:transposase-like protein